MKPTYLTLGLIATFVGGNATASDFGYHANGIAGVNIAAMQHNIVNHAIVLPAPTNIASKIGAKNNPSDIYGEMLYYGEYGDDTGILPLVGRNGGDASSAYIGANWQHVDESVKFKSYAKMDTTMDLGMVEFGNKYNAMFNRPLDIKFFGGYVGGDIKNSEVRIDQDGGFIGVAAHQRINRLNINAVADFGLMANNARTLPATDKFNNLWFAINVDASYDFAIDDVMILRSSVRGGYMWITAPNYILANNEYVNNKDIAVAELTPAIDLVANIGDGWLMDARGAYVMNFVSGGRTYVDYTQISKLKTDNYFEYGISIMKSVGDLNFGANVGRHDGGRRGWFGGANVKYIF